MTTGVMHVGAQPQRDYITADEFYSTCINKSFVSSENALNNSSTGLYNDTDPFADLYDDDDPLPDYPEGPGVPIGNEMEVLFILGLAYCVYKMGQNDRIKG